MGIVRIDPAPRAGNSLFGGVKRIARFAANPVAELVNSVQAIHAPRRELRFWPVEWDTDTGEVTITAPKRGKGLISRYADRFAPSTARIERLLEETVRTGTVAGGLTGAYREVADLLLKSAPVPAPAPGDTTTWSQYDMASSIIPPGGMAGFLQMTPASKLALTGSRGLRSRSARRKKRATKRKSPSRKRAGSTRSRSKRGSKLVKGSAAAKRYMASIRKKRKK